MAPATKLTILKKYLFVYLKDTQRERDREQDLVSAVHSLNRHSSRTGQAEAKYWGLHVGDRNAATWTVVFCFSGTAAGTLIGSGVARTPM